MSHADALDEQFTKDARALLQFFTWQHLPEHLQAMSKPFAVAAERLVNMTSEERAAQIDLMRRSYVSLLSELCGEIDRATPPNIEATEAVIKIDAARQALIKGADERSNGQALRDAVRWLLEAKDCAVRSLLFKH